MRSLEAVSTPVAIQAASPQGRSGGNSASSRLRSTLGPTRIWKLRSVSGDALGQSTQAAVSLSATPLALA